jgi:hypothetical protein
MAESFGLLVFGVPIGVWAKEIAEPSSTANIKVICKNLNLISIIITL